MVSTALSRRLRYTAPVLALGVVAAGVSVPRLADAAGASAALPQRTAAELLVAVSEAEVEGLSGTVVATSRLGLPELPSTDDGGSALSLPGLLSGSTTARVWKAGDDRSRIAVDDASWAEFDVVRDGRDLWTYDSASNDVTHLTLPEHASHHDPEPAPAPAGAATPQELADALLASVDPTTTVTVGRAEEVAGRPAYELVLEPKDERTLIRTVRIAVDGETSVPLRVRVYGDGQPEPAAEVTFTDVDFEVPDAQAFSFDPPPGATVTERSLEHGAARSAPRAPEDRSTTAPPTVHGTGWSTVVELSGVELSEQAAGLAGQLAEPADGGQVVTSAVLSVLLLDDGRVLAGAVPPSYLEELARS